MEARPNILILCTGNSCRSQMAAGFLRHLAGNRFNVYSAGTGPADRVHPLAIEVMAEKGIDISDARPTDVGEHLGRLAVRYLIIVCHGANERCPWIFPGMFNRLFWPFDDPAGRSIDDFRRVRDETETRTHEWLAEVSQAR